MNFFIGPADYSNVLPGFEVLLERVEAPIDGSRSTRGSEASPYGAVVAGAISGELVEASVSRDSSSIVVDGSAASAAALAWVMRDLAELEVYDEAYTVAVPLADVGDQAELSRRLALA